MATMHDGEDTDNPEVQHEGSDVNIRAILTFALGLFVVAAAVHIVIYLMFVYLTNRQASGSAVRTYPLSVGQEDRLPPEPRLQTNPKQDLRDLRSAEEQALNSYRWVDRNAGVVGIPVSEAMRLTLQRGLPSRPDVPQSVPQQSAPQQQSGTPQTRSTQERH